MLVTMDGLGAIAVDWAAVHVLVIEFLPGLVFVAALMAALLLDRVTARWRVRRVARQLGAQVERAKGALFPVLTWHDGPRTAKLAFPRRHHGISLRATVCDVELETPVRLAFTVKRRSVLGQASLWFWTPTPREEARTGNAQFDRAFVVRGSDTEVLREWLTRDLRRALLRMAGQVGGHTIRVECDGERVTASLDGAVTNGKSLKFFAETAVWLARAVGSVAVPQAVHFESALASREGSTFTLRGCPACAEPVVRDDAERCPACAAPHHAPCWEYLGGCGVWGCTGGAPRHSPSAA